MAPNLLQNAGAQPNKQPKYVPIFIDRAFTGIWTQRSVLHDPSDIATAHFYGGRPDALWQGSNVELTNRLTLQRRPGLTPFSAATYPTPPQRAFAFELTNGTIRVIIDTGPSPVFNLSSVNAISGAAYYIFTSPVTCAANNAYVGLIFNITGFDQTTNNGAFTCTASTSSYLLLSNASAINDTSAATAVTSGGVYWDTQVGGISYLLFAKSADAGQTGFVSVAGTLYMGDGVDTRKYTPLNNNGTIANSVAGQGSIWNYSIAAPTSQPAVTIVESGASAVPWESSTFYSTMGLLVDSNGNIEYLTGINNSGTNTTQFGTTGQGQPQWSSVTGNPPASGEDGSCNWLCAGSLSLWQSQTAYTTGACIYVPGVGGTPLPAFSETNGNNTGVGVNCPGTTGGGIWQAFPHGGTSGSSTPKWSPISNTHTDDFNGTGSNDIEWQYLGPAILWQPNHIYNSWWEHLQMCVVEPSLPNLALLEAGTQTIFVQTNNNQSTGSVNVQGTSGSGYTPPWPLAANTSPSSVGQTTGDGDLQWICLGWGTWKVDTEYVAWTAGASQFSAIKDGNNNFQVCLQGGLSGINIAATPYNGWLPSHVYATSALIAVKSTGGYYQFSVLFGGGTSSRSTEPVWNFTTGNNTHDGSITWRCNGPLPASQAVWGTTYGAQTRDNEVIWTCVGSAVDSTWTASTQWYFPASGFAAPTSSQAYGGAEVIANGDVQIVIDSGLSGSATPHWGAIGTTTQDGFAVWYTNSVVSPNSLAWQVGYVYAYSYKARSLDDYYSTPSYVYTGPGQSTFQIPIPPGLKSALPPPSGSETEGISTASPVFTITGVNAGAVNYVTVTGSLDPQVDTIVIWRCADGGGPSNMFELTEIPNPKPVNGAPGVATFADYLPDVATLSATGVLYPGLDEEIPAPIDGINNPPLSNFIPMTYNFQRIWGAAGQEVLWSGGPDTLTGTPNEAYNVSDNFSYLANVTRIVKNSQGQVVFLTDSVEFIAGGPSTQSFFSITLAPGIGLNNFNAVDVYAGDLVFFSSDSQLKSINPSLQLANMGFPIGDQLALLDSSEVGVAYHQNGIDNAIYVSDNDTGWWRVNPRQIPGGLNGPEPVWSTFSAITGGAGMVQSVETTPGIKQLLVGGTGCNQQILVRNLNVFTDYVNGVQTPYDAYFVMGSVVLAHPGQLAILRFIEMDCSGVNYQPVVSVLLNEISGNFQVLPTTDVFDPPSLYGTTISPTSYSPQRWYFASTGSLARARHIQIKCDLGTTSNGDEVLSLTIYGRLMVEL